MLFSMMDVLVMEVEEDAHKAVVQCQLNTH